MKKLSKEDKAGLYITVIVHVSVVIILLVASLGFSLKNESSFILDFTKIEEIERLQKELAFKEQVSHRLDEIISEAGGIPTRNIAVDRGALKDDRGTNAEELYKDAERIQKELNESLRRKVENSGDYVEQNDSREPEKKEKSYSGPSVLSWELSGRKAVKLPIPAYRCMGAGEVRVLIEVDPKGMVLSANIDEASSSKDGCLRNFAVRAARLSKFSISESAPSRQSGNIVYKFIAQ